MRFFFLGIGGTAMGNAALLMRECGHEVSGCDSGVYPPMSDLLRDRGIEWTEGYDSKRVEESIADCVVVGNALSRGNPAVEWLLARPTPRRVSLPALLYETVLNKRSNIVVAGTHGKTTTTALTAWLLQNNGVDPGYFIGGVADDFAEGAKVGDVTAPFVIEGDEYDSAFFDKRSKFIHYDPQFLVLNNLEFDHADIFRDLADVKRAFSHLLRVVRPNGLIFYNADDENLCSLLPVPWAECIGVGMRSSCDLRIGNYRETDTGSSFTLTWRGKKWQEVSSPLHGTFNARNVAMAAISAGSALCPEEPARLELHSLARFRGVRRRQEVIARRGALVVMEDFAHHPTAIRETLTCLRACYPDHRLVAAMEPRSNTMRMNHLQDDLAEALAPADEVYLGAVNRTASLEPEIVLDTAAVARVLEKGKRRTVAAASNEALLQALRERQATWRDEPTLVVFFSNGSFDGIARRYADGS